MEEYLLVAFILILASFVHGLSGFGFPMVAMPLLSLFFGIKFIIPLVAIYVLVLVVILLYKLRKNISRKKALPLIVGSIIGTPVGVFLLKALDERLIKLCLGIIIIIYSLYALFVKLKEADIKDYWGYIAGFFGGALAGAFNIGAPPAVMYLSLKEMTKDEIKTVLQLYYLFSAALRLLLYGFIGLITKEIGLYALYLLPFLFMGEIVGSFLYKKIDKEMFNKIISLILLASGILLVVRSF